VIYDAVRETDEQEVIIKQMDAGAPKVQTTYQLRNEYEILSKINSHRVIKVLEFASENNQPYLVFEYWKGKDLTSVINNPEIDIAAKLKLAILIAQTVGEIHQCNVIHRDIKPDNILTNADEDDIKIVDFGIASLVSREMQQLFLNLDVLEGSISYISPEQSGRMNRAVDYRTDIYSLGVTLYELFTKKLPFIGTNPKEVIYKHIAVSPQPPIEINHELPEALSEVLMKCLEKNAEDRYQSAFGLKNDLESIYKQYLLNAKIEHFIPGAQDVYDHFQITQKLYGREKEIKALHQIFTDICNGPLQIILLKGYAGIGKTSVVRELYKSIIAHKGYYAEGKFELLKKGDQYFALIQALQQLVFQVLAESKDQFTLTQERILNLLGTQGQLLIELVPDIKLIIGPQPQLPELSPSESEVRFQHTLSCFLDAFCGRDQPLVIFLDDLQWIDESSLKFLEFYTSDTNRHNVLFIGAYRDNEVDALHPLIRSLKETKEAGVPIDFIELAPLLTSSVKDLIHDSFRMRTKASETLSSEVYAKTKGNPFFTVQFLKSLYVNNLLNFNPVEQEWESDNEKIEELPVTENVADFLMQKLRRLPQNTQMALQTGAAVGSHFMLQTLAEVHQTPPDKILQDLEEARREELIVMHLNAGLHTDTVEFIFQHDRIQSAAYDLIETSARPSLHYRIGNALLNLAGQKREENIIEIVTQLNYGLQTITNKQERIKIAALNLEAGRKARLVAAYPTGLSYLKAGLDLLGKTGWDTDYKLYVALNENLLACLQMSGARNEVKTTIQQVLPHLKHRNDKVQVYLGQLASLIQEGRLEEALQTCLTALSLYDIRIDAEPSKLKTISLLFWMLLNFKIKGTGYIAKLPKVARQDTALIGEIYENTAKVSFTRGDGKLTFYVCYLNAKRLLKEGNYEYASSLIAMLGAIIAHPPFSMTKLGIECGMISQALAKCHPHTRGAADWAYYWSALILPLSSHQKACENPLRDAYKELIKAGSIYNAGMCQLSILLTMLKSGDSVDVLIKESELYLYNVLSTYKDPVYLSRAFPLHEFFLRLKGAYSEHWKDVWKEKFHQDIDNVQDFGQDISVSFMRAIFQLCHAYLLELPQKKLEAACKEIDAFKGSVAAFNPDWPIAYFYEALAFLSLYEKTSDATKWKEVANLQGKLKHLASHSPSYTHQISLIEAEKARIQKKYTEAGKYYEKAIKEADEGGYMQDQALICKLYAINFSTQGMHKLASTYMGLSCDLYAQWKADAILQMLNAHYPKLVEPASLSSTSTNLAVTNPMATSLASNQLFDIETLMEGSQMLSREIVFDKLINSLMHIVMVNAGASRGFLIMPESEKLIVKAEITKTKSEATLIDVPLESREQDLSLSIVSFVVRTKQPLSLNDAIHTGSFTKDPYVLDKKPKSILCFPLLQQEHLKGVIYLENESTSNAFPPHRVKVLNFLSSQMAISIENAQFYATLEEKVRDRTAQLSEKNTQLVQTLDTLNQVKDQLIQQEKLASMGILAKGLAHELKNPLNFILNFTHLTGEELKEIDENLEKGPPEELKEHCQQALELVNKVWEYAKRADNIINAMGMYSRSLDTKAVKHSIPKIIEEALEVVTNDPRYSNDPLFHPKIDKVYDASVPEITVFPRSLHQVFVNILDNSMYFLQQKIKKAPAGFGPHIEIKLSVEENFVKIVFTDNGSGIPKANLAKVFSPFFTTKPTGVGTGLGLLIGFGIVKGQHGGLMTVESEENLYTTTTVQLPIK